MADQDALSGFDFSSFGGSGLFVKFQADKPVTLRVLTVDPVVQTQEFKDDKTGEITLSTKFCFIVYNFTEGKAQILSASPGIAKKIGEIHADPDFGANIRAVDIKISPTGESLRRKYELQVLQKTNEMTNKQIKEAQAIDLDKNVKDGTRMSLWTQEKPKPSEDDGEDPGTEDDEEEPINLDDIPF